MKSIQFSDWTSNLSSSVQQQGSYNDGSAWEDESVENKSRDKNKFCYKWSACVKGLVVGLLLAGICLAVVLTLWLRSNSVKVTTTVTTTITTATTTSATTSTSTTATTTTSTSSTTSTTTTTTITCLTGYVLASAGSCVNTQIDFNNCGSIGYVCTSNYTSCSAGVCSTAPAVQLTNGVSVSGWGGSTSVDDAYQTINLPFTISMYNYSTSNASVTTNGVVCLGGCSTVYGNGNLPSSSFAGPTAFAYWDDLYIYSGTSQSVYYGFEGTAPNRSVIFEFYEGHIGTQSEFYQFQIVFYENLPGIVKYIYYQTTDGGISATVGVQESGTGAAMTYSVNQVMLTNNMTLTFDTNTGTYTG